MKVEDFYDMNCEKGSLIISVCITEDNRTIPFSVKINLYKLTGCKPELVASQQTDCNGQLVFKGLDYGYYRVVEVVNKQQIKPKYIPWNEFEINSDNLWHNIEIINTRVHQECKDEHTEGNKCIYNDLGTIKVHSILGKCLREPIEGLEVELFRLECCELKEAGCKVTNEKGVAEFQRIPFGKYIIVQKINKCYFTNPCYLKSQLVVLDKDNKKANVVVVNSIKQI